MTDINKIDNYGLDFIAKHFIIDVLKQIENRIGMRGVDFLKSS